MFSNYKAFLLTVIFYMDSLLIISAMIIIKIFISCLQLLSIVIYYNL